MNLVVFQGGIDPIIVPIKSSGKLTHKVIIKKDFVREDGTSALYLQFFQNKKRKRLPLHISVPVADFDTAKQRVKRTNPYHESFNLLIGQKLAEVNRIMVNFRLSNQEPTLEAMLESLTNPSLRMNFNAFVEEMLKQQKGVIKHSTYRQQKGWASKIKSYQDPIFFTDIDKDFLNDLKRYCKTILKNKPATIEGTLKNFKKYLHLANERGIRTELKFSDIKVKKMTGTRVFLLPEELKRLYDYFQSGYIVGSRKNILQRYLFACFTGIRISDVEQLKEQNFIGDHLAFTMHKTQKFIRIKLNKTARSFIKLPQVFEGHYTREHINRELKSIAFTIGINKRLYFHSSRHTFATNFLISGGDVVNLQRLLGHSKIEETMIYVHIVESITDRQVDLLDAIVNQ